MMSCGSLSPVRLKNLILVTSHANKTSHATKRRYSKQSLFYRCKVEIIIQKNLPAAGRVDNLFLSIADTVCRFATSYKLINGSPDGSNSSNR
jgi:hypothetical protein